MYNLWPLFFLFIGAGQLSSSWATIIRNCGDPSNGRLTDLKVSGCEFNDDPDKCILVKGKTATFVAKFQNVDSTTQANLKIYGILMKRVRVPFAIGPDACTSWGVQCPLSENTNSTMTISLPVKNEYPAIPVDIEVSVQNDKNVSIFCLQFAAQLKSEVRKN